MLIAQAAIIAGTDAMWLMPMPMLFLSTASAMLIVLAAALSHFVLTAQAVVCVCGIGACSMLGPRSSACCVLVFANSCSWHVHVSWHFMFWTSVSICELIKFGIWGILFSWLIHVSDHSLLTKAFQ